MTEQFALDLPVRPDFSAGAFIPGAANADARSALAAWRTWPRHAMALIGSAGAGKSHLAAIWAEEAGARSVRAQDLDAVLPGIESGQALLVEDVDRDVPEQALFHAINRAAQSDMPGLLLTARKPTVLWPVQVPDLVSRVRALPHVDLHEPDDELLSRVLEKLFQDRRAPVNPGVVDYLLPRMERSVDAARMLVERLDKRALVKMTPVSRSIARDILNALSDEEES